MPSSETDKYGLTGGIGSGKSLACDFFQALGVPVLDSDALARELTSSDRDCLSQIEHRFGSEYLNKEGQLNRPRMRELVFSDPQARKDLEAILHPRIRHGIQSWEVHGQHGYGIVAVPLLVENRLMALFDGVIVVDCDEQLQLERASKRDDSKAPDIQRIMNAQATRSERLQHADFILHNDGPPETLQAQVADLHQRLRHSREVS